MGNKYKFTVLLSASVPSEKRSERYNEVYTKIKNAQIQIEEAIITLCRNIFHAGGRIIFGGHPSISPLVAMIASEFADSDNDEMEHLGVENRNDKKIIIYQSRAYEEVIPKETSILFELGYSEIKWVDAVDNEKCDLNIKNQTQCDKSLLSMRTKMIHENEIDALVCIGGMDGVEKEFELFREYKPTAKIFILETTGGASKILAKEYSRSEFIKIPDTGYSRQIENKRQETGEEKSKFELVPYSFLTSLIVKELTGNNGSNLK